VKRLIEKEKDRENMASSHIRTYRNEFMIITATEADGSQIQSIAARAGVFSLEEVDSVQVMWREYLTLGPEDSGYHFIAYREGDRVLGFAIYGPRDLTDGVFDLYWISVDPAAQCKGVGRALLTASENAVRAMGGRMLIAETSGTPHYEPARKFYFAMGYENEAIIRDFYTPGDDLLIFIKRI
jgi:ribosomal protein S18 acetylase RimI-like enzyme